MALSRYRELGSAGTDWPEWLRALRWSSGVYVIRRLSDGATVYVGESHTGRLASTVQRHFQRWTGYTAGTTYQRAKHEIAIEETSAEDAPGRQYALIERLAPEDNSYGQAEFHDDAEDEPQDDSDIPF